MGDRAQHHRENRWRIGSETAHAFAALHSYNQIDFYETSRGLQYDGDFQVLTETVRAQVPLGV